MMKMGKHSEKEYRKSFLSSISSSNSQGSGSLFSPSIISELEPSPDLKNWFSSYTYQSPALDTGDGFADCFTLREGVNDGTELRVEDSEDEGEEDEWVDSKKTGKSGLLGIAEKSLVNGTGAPNYSDSLSLPSEPLDVRNWFSSYLYESPKLNSDDIGVSLYSYVCSDNIEEADKREEENLNEHNYEKAQDGPGGSKYNRASTDLVGSSSQSKKRNHLARKDQRGSGSSKNSPFKYNLCSQMNPGPSGAAMRSGLVKELLNNDFHGELEAEVPVFSPIEVVDIPKGPKQLKGHTIQAQGGQPTTTRDSVRYSNHKNPAMILRSQDNGTKCDEEGGVPKATGDENNSGWILPINKSREGTRAAKSKEDKIYMLRENGSTPFSKKENLRMNNGNCIEKVPSSRSTQDAYEPLGAAAEKDTEPRRVLKDMTNHYTSDGVEIAGKWRCPQKRKPYDGPPLKQLRLEQWVHRVKRM